MADTLETKPEIVTVKVPDTSVMTARVVVGCGQDPKQCRAMGLLKDLREKTGDHDAVFCINTNLPFVGADLRDTRGLRPRSFCGVEISGLANAPRTS